ncbi:hypothetical protein ACFXKW_37760 [Streptomyces sp. NPDC059193]|uniref:hypothetical protein n=1 Tax=Streptomyces sp. NPDC059193 TaxID=3346763 RepID=UPI0036B6C26A
MAMPDPYAQAWTVRAKIDPGAPWTSPEFFDGEGVGHVWLEVISPLGESMEFGFYPQNPSVRSVQGMIICPDRHGGDKERKTATISLQDVALGYHAAFDRRDTRYQLAGYNCASFASDVWQAMTGKPLPNGLLIPNPSSAAESVRIERELRKAFNGQPMSDGVEDLIEMTSSGVIPPAM